MRKKLLISIHIFIVFIVLIGCGSTPNNKEKNTPISVKKGELFQVKSVEKFSTMNGFKVEDGRFYFSGIKNEQWGFYALDLNTHQLEQRYNQIGEYDVFIPLNGEDAIYINIDGELFVREDGKDRKIDDEVYGAYRPNILVSPDQKGILYTKGEQDHAALYRYLLDEEKPKKIKDRISKDAFFTFSYTTLWSNNSHFFIHDNSEVYNDEGKLYDVIHGTSAVWAPNDEMIAFIRKPEDIKDKQIFVGDWQSYIGTEFAIYSIKEKESETIYENKDGLIDATDSIRWAKDSSLAAISIGKINRTTTGELENIQYEKVFAYNLEDGTSKEVNNIPYNFYEVLFDTYLYGSSIGKRDQVEIVHIFEEDRTIFDHPVILNSRDMFVISHEDKAYLINGRELMEFSKEGKSTKLMELPWEINEMYFDAKLKTLILINKEHFLFVIKL